MTPRRKKRLAVVGIIVAAVAIAISLMIYALNQNMNLFYTPSQIIYGRDGHVPKVGERLRVGGVVVAGSVKRDPDDLDVRFKLKDIGPDITVQYSGILPDLFREGQGIVAQGVLIDKHTVKASEVLAKHDEKYMPPDVKDAMKDNTEFNKAQASKRKESQP
ncbi:cytochrome c maturation protein CcmE [Vibrio palustris]|uniref:Cytochrome c-type biogenesis protein CcmE n=1 Tax=Vibrio palustris TaxID=1918946 RepID=A0A1R4B0F2_9VIBR|nr:cytochrome c maturation protein CcmE [Vibrio palustris]SJL82406.1 Cytochrome c-type biogenesis protein CcmE [Vibrio palustris]